MTNAGDQNQPERTRVDPLEKALEALTITNDELRRQLSDVVDKQWALPKFVFAAVSTVLAIFFGVNLYSQTVALAGAKEHLENAKREMANLVDKQNKLRDAFREDAKTALDESRDDVSHFREAYVRAERASYRLSALIGVGQSHLYQRQSPHDALMFAKKALPVYDEYMENDNSSEDNMPVEQLAALLFSFYAEASWQAGETEDLGLASSRLSEICGKENNDECWGIEASRYKALYQLKLATNIVDEDFQDDRRAKMASALSILRSVYSESRDRDWTTLLIGLAWLDMGDEATAQKAFREIVERSAELTLSAKSLSATQNAITELAKAGAQVTAFANGEATTTATFDCNLERGGITAADADLLARFFSHFSTVIPSRIDDSSVAKEDIQAFCSAVVEALRRVCGEGACENCSPTMENNGILPAAPEPAPSFAPPAPVVDPSVDVPAPDAPST